MEEERRYTWAKVYCELPRDLKLVGRSAHDCWLWVCLILLARESEEPGTVLTLQARVAYLAQYARLRPKAVVEALNYFEAAGMVTLGASGSITVEAFQRRQERPRQSPSDRPERIRDRVARHRAQLDANRSASSCSEPDSATENEVASGASDATDQMQREVVVAVGEDCQVEDQLSVNDATATTGNESEPAYVTTCNDPCNDVETTCNEDGNEAVTNSARKRAEGRGEKKEFTSSSSSSHALAREGQNPGNDLWDGPADPPPADHPPPLYAFKDLAEEQFLNEEDLTWAQTIPKPKLTAAELYAMNEEFQLYWRGRPDRRMPSEWNHAWRSRVLEQSSRKGTRLSRARGS